MERTDFEQWKGREVARLLALVETERRYYQEMVAALPVAVAVLAPDRSIVSANRTFRHLFGVTIDEVRKKSADQLLPSERLIESIRDMHVHGGARAPFVITANGRAYRIAIVPIRNWNEEMELETLLLVQDANELSVPVAPPEAPFDAQREVGEAPVGMTPAPMISKTPEATVAEAPASQEMAPEVSAVQPEPEFPIETLPAIVWQADAATFAITAVSGAAQALLGYPISHWLETPNFITSRIHPEDRDATIALYRATIAHGGEASAEFRVTTNAGDIVWCRETILVPVPVPDPGSAGMRLHGDNRKVSGVLTGLRQRKQLERQLVTSERHAALTGLSARLAHDLNNPLMIITGYSEEMLQSFEENDPRRADIEQILGATQRIGDLTAQLLHFTRRPPTNIQPMNVSLAILNKQEKLAQAAGYHTALTLSCGEPLWAYADPAQLEEVLTALISRHVEEAAGRTQASIVCDTSVIVENLEGGLAPGSYARITIQDNGVGLSREKRATLFESLFSKEPEITGTAIAHAYAQVRQWGGDIAVESEPFRGTRYSIYLRQAEPVPESVPEPVQPVTIVETEAPWPTILVVDDEPGIRALVAKILRRERYDVIEAGTVQEAIGLAQSQMRPLNLLVTDVMLPDQSGRELAESLSQTVPGIKVLYISGFTDNESVRMGEFPEGSMFLQKPFTLGALVGRVRDALQG